ncbi:MAG: SIMPL domain-containing protein [Alistipes sp.]|nr:SIMPL domain-containing protein [Alistipes sp.]
MKKWTILAAALMLAAPLFAQSEENFPSYIQVNGRAEREIAPDEFYLSIVIDERESKGKVTVEEQQRQLVSALRKLGIAVDKQLKMANLSSDLFRKSSAAAVAKYQLLLGSAQEVAAVTAALNDKGITNVSIARVTHSRIDALKQEVRLEAVRNARDSARALAEAIGQKAGKCFYIYDANYDISPRYYDNSVMIRAKGFASDTAEAAVEEEAGIDFRTIRLEYNVQTKFILE